MRYFTTKTERPATKTTTFNMTEEAQAIVKETVKGLKLVGVNITQGEVINDLITSHSSNHEKIYQVDDKKYTIGELCEISFLAKINVAVESYIAMPKVIDLSKKLYVQLAKIENSLYAQVSERVIDELEESFNEHDDEEEMELDEYIDAHEGEKEEVIYDEVLEENIEDISKQIYSKVMQFKNELSMSIYDVPFIYLSKDYHESVEKIEEITKHFINLKEMAIIIKGLAAYRRYTTNEELTSTQVNCIFKEVLNESPVGYKFDEAIVRMKDLLEQKGIELDGDFFVKIAANIEKDMFAYLTGGVNIY